MPAHSTAHDMTGGRTLRTLETRHDAFYRSRHGRWSNPSNPGNPPRRESRRLREATSAVVSLIRGQVWGARHQKGWTKNSTRSRGRRCEELEEQRNTTHTNTHRHTTHHTPHTARRARHTIDHKSRVNKESELRTRLRGHCQGSKSNQQGDKNKIGTDSQVCGARVVG